MVTWAEAPFETFMKEQQKRVGDRAEHFYSCFLERVMGDAYKPTRDWVSSARHLLKLLRGQDEPQESPFNPFGLIRCHITELIDPIYLYISYIIYYRIPTHSFRQK